MTNKRVLFFSCFFIFLFLFTLNLRGDDKTFTSSIGMEFILIPAGSFTMGADKNFEEFGQLIEAEALELHSIMLTQRPALIYWTPGTLQIMKLASHFIWGSMR